MTLVKAWGTHFELWGLGQLERSVQGVQRLKQGLEGVESERLVEGGQQQVGLMEKERWERWDSEAPSSAGVVLEPQGVKAGREGAVGSEMVRKQKKGSLEQRGGRELLVLLGFQEEIL